MFIFLSSTFIYFNVLLCLFSFHTFSATYNRPRIITVFCVTIVNANLSIRIPIRFPPRSRLVGCFGFNGPLRQYFSLYRAVSQREGERGERIVESKNVQTTPTRTYCKRNRPMPTCQIKIVGRPGTGSLPRTLMLGRLPVAQSNVCSANDITSQI